MMNRIPADVRIGTGLGLATNTYKQVLSSGELSVRELIAWAAGRGFSWVELRDPDVEMTPEELEAIHKLADDLGVRIHYAWDNTDTLSPDERFLKGMDNAAVFGPGTCCRVLIAPGAVSGHKGNDLLAIPANNPAASRAAHTADPFTDIFALLYHPADPYRGRHS